MAASTTTGFAITMPAAETVNAAVNRRRSISPGTGRALLTLGHAIEYLTNQIVDEGGPFTADNSQMQAMQLLMAINHRIYSECPEVPPLGKGFLSFLLHPKK